MNNFRKYIIWGTVFAGVLALIYLALKPKPTGVDLGEVTIGELLVTVDEDGETMIREPYIISAPLAGRLLRVELEPGDPIEEDTVLAVLDPGEPGLLDARTLAEAKARVSAAEANFQRGQSQLDVAKAEMEKWQRYFERDGSRLKAGTISPPLFEDTKHSLRIAKNNFNAAESALDVSRFELDQARAALLHSKSPEPKPADRHFIIKSPIRGVVLRKFRESSTVIPGGERILEIGDPRDLEIRIDVLSQDAVKIRPGQRVMIEHWGGKGDLTAHVRRVEPSAFTKVSALGVDEQRVYVYADFSGEGGANSSLGDGYRIEARIVVWEKADALKIPAGALFRSGESWAVYTMIENRALLRKIEVGERNGIEVEVLEGLKKGDRVVLHPGDRVDEGSLLEEREK